MLSHFSCFWLFVTPWTVTLQAPVHGILQARILEWPAIAFSRDLPHPGTEPASLTSPALAGGFFTTSASWEALILEWVAMSSSWDLPNPGITPRSPTLQADSSLSEPPGKPKNPGVGSLPLLQGTFPTQGSNWGLLHCRWVLYHLSHPGSPLINESDVIIDITILLLANCKNFDFYVYVDF